MDMIGKVRRMKWRDQLSDGEICRRTGLARNTVKKWLKAPGDIPPKYERKKADGKLTPFVAVLEQALRTDAHRAKNARRSGKALFAQIQAQGYRGGYSAVTDFIRAWRVDSAKDPAKAFVPLSFELGEAFQFDWSEEGLLRTQALRQVTGRRRPSSPAWRVSVRPDFGWRFGGYWMGTGKSVWMPPTLRCHSSTTSTVWSDRRAAF